MEATYDNSVEAFSSTPNTTLESAAFAVGGTDRVLYVFVSTGAGSPVIPSAVRWGGSGGTALTQIGTTIDHHTNGKFSVWRLINPTAQTSTIHVTWPSSQDERYFIGVSYKDVDQATPNDTVAQATGTGVAPTVNATSASGKLVISGVTFIDTGGNGFTLSTSDTSRQEIEGADLLFEGSGASEKTATGSSTTMAWTISDSASWGIFALTLNGSSSAPSGANLSWISA